MASDDSKNLASRMKHEPFSIATDGSTDVDTVKLYPVYKPMPGAQKSQVSLIVIQIAEVSMFTVYKFTVTEVEVRSIILTFFAVYFSMYKLEFYTFL